MAMGGTRHRGAVSLFRGAHEWFRRAWCRAAGVPRRRLPRLLHAPARGAVLCARPAADPPPRRQPLPAPGAQDQREPHTSAGRVAGGKTSSAATRNPVLTSEVDSPRTPHHHTTAQILSVWLEPEVEISVSTVPSAQAGQPPKVVLQAEHCRIRCAAAPTSTHPSVRTRQPPRQGSCSGAVRCVAGSEPPSPPHTAWRLLCWPPLGQKGKGVCAALLRVVQGLGPGREPEARPALLHAIRHGAHLADGARPARAVAALCPHPTATATTAAAARPRVARARRRVRGVGRRGAGERRQQQRLVVGRRAAGSGGHGHHPRRRAAGRVVRGDPAVQPDAPRGAAGARARRGRIPLFLCAGLVWAGWFAALCRVAHPSRARRVLWWHVCVCVCVRVVVCRSRRATW